MRQIILQQVQANDSGSGACGGLLGHALDSLIGEIRRVSRAQASVNPDRLRRVAELLQAEADRLDGGAQRACFR